MDIAILMLIGLFWLLVYGLYLGLAALEATK